MDKGIKILELNKFFENEENQDIKNNYMGSIFNGFNNKIYKLL